MRTVTADFSSGKTKVRTAGQIYQYDVGDLLEIVGLDLPELYQVHFANGAAGASVRQTATSAMVEIPSDVTQSGEDVIAYIFLTPDEDIAYTDAQATIRVAPRAELPDGEPSGDQADEISRAISAMNEGVDRAQAAAQIAQEASEVVSADKTIVVDAALNATQSAQQSALNAETASGAASAAEGHARAASTLAGQAGQAAQDASDSAQTASNASGAAEAAAAAAGRAVDEVQSVVDTALAEAKASGEFDGADGFSPIASVEQTATGATVTVTDKTHTTMANLTNGTDGISPTITITDITGGHRVTITDAEGTHSMDVMDGTGSVQDVQVNGTSVVQDGVANVPLATANSHGVIRVSTGLGINNAGNLYVVLATSEQVKAGTFKYASITPSVQHGSTFYGLAKAAGDTSQSASDNAVGAYTDAAKIAIQKMLGIYEAPWELIREETFTNATEADHIISVDANQQSFELTDAILFIELPKQPQTVVIGTYGSVYFSEGSSTKITAYFGAQNYDGTNISKYAIAKMTQEFGMLFMTYTPYGGSNTSAAITRHLNYGELTGAPFRLMTVTIDNVVIKSVTGTMNYRLYGRRKWN